MKLILLIVAVVLFAIGAILALAGGNVGSFGPVDFAVFGLPFFAASFLPIP